VHWIHVGRATCLKSCQLLAIDAQHLISLLKKHRLVQQFSHGYATEFYNSVCVAKPPHSIWPTDLGVPNCDFFDIVVSLPQDIRTAIGLHVLEGPSGLKQLRHEVLNGTSSLVPSNVGNPQRVVLVVAFHIERDDGRMLVQLGQREEHDPIIALCMLPGAKYSSDDGVDTVAKRVLDTKLAPLSANVDVVRSRRETSEYTSLRHGVHTKYVRTIFHASMCRPRTALWGSQNAMNKVPSVLRWKKTNSMDPSKWDVFTIDHSRRTTMYAWLTKDEFRQLGDRSCRQSELFLQQMLSAIWPEPECSPEQHVLSNSEAPSEMVVSAVSTSGDSWGTEIDMLHPAFAPPEQMETDVAW